MGQGVKFDDWVQPRGKVVDLPLVFFGLGVLGVPEIEQANCAFALLNAGRLERLE